MIGLLLSCNNEPDTVASDDMLMELDRLAKSERPIVSLVPGDPIKSFNINTLWEDENTSISRQLDKALYLIVMGKEMDAVHKLTELVDDGITDTNRAFMACHLLGFAYQRMGEVNNCAGNHQPSSCIIPFAEEAIHTDTMGSAMAIKYYKLALEQKPHEPLTRWLMTICYQTLGRATSGNNDLVDLEQFYKADHRVNLNTRTAMDKKEYILPDSAQQFKNVASEMGLHGMAYFGAMVVEDFNNDGRLDVFTTSYRLSDNVKFYQNTDKGFVDVTEKAGLKGMTGGVHATHADYDNDGHEDLLVLRGGWLEEQGHQPPSLLHNNGDGTFTDVTFEAGIVNYWPCHTATWADFNNDGLLDLFVGLENFTDTLNEAARSKLYIAQKDGTFKDQALTCGIDLIAYVKGSIATDYNNDGLPDLYVSCYKGLNKLYINQGVGENGLPSFKDEALMYELSEPFNSFAVALLDDNKIVRAGYKLELSALTTEYELGHSIDHKTSELALYGVTDRPVSAMGLGLGDLNNDGILDIYAATGAADLRALYPNVLLMSNRGEGYKDETVSTRTGHLQKGHGVSMADFDNDGDADIFVNTGGVLPTDVFFDQLYLNPGNDMNWVKVKLIGELTNRSAIGAKVTIQVTDPSGKQIEIHRTVGATSSFGSDPNELHIGLGYAEKVDMLSIYWPGLNGGKAFYDLPANHRIVAREMEDKVQVEEVTPLKFELGEVHDHHLGHSPFEQ